MKKKYYAFVQLAAATLLSAAGAGLLSYVSGSFIKPISEAFEASRAGFSGSITVTTVAAMIFLPIMGRVFKKHRLKSIVLPACITAIVMLICSSMVNEMWMFYPLAAVNGVCQCCISAMPIVILTSNWFAKKKGLVSSIAFSGGGLMSMLFSPMLNHVIESAGWQAGYRVLAIVFAVITIPTLLFVVKESPAEVGMLPYGIEQNNDSKQPAELPQATGYLFSQAVKTRGFWMYCAAIFLIALTSRGAQQHLISFWSDAGYTYTFSAMLYSITMGTGIVGKIVLGEAYDRLGIKKAGGLICGVAILSYILLCFSGASDMVALSSAVLIGASSAIQIAPATYGVNKMFGDKDYSSNYGLTTTFFYMGASLGALIPAGIFDRFCTYEFAWYLFAGITLLIFALLVWSYITTRSERIKLLGENDVAEM